MKLVKVHEKSMLRGASLLPPFVGEGFMPSR